MKHIEIATTQLGVQEIPKNSNAGPDVEKYLKAVGLGKGYAWCMAFVFWCVFQAYGKTGLIKTAGVMRQWNEIPAVYKFKFPKVGDIFILDFGKGVGHTGFVEFVDPDGIHIHTIEGNTNDEGSREGYEVCRRTRKISECVGFIRLQP